MSNDKQSSDHIPDVGKKVSSVEQLVNSLIKLGYLHSNGFGQSLKVTEIINQAKAMHKEEIRKAYCYGEYYKDAKLTTDYYNETFGGNNENHSKAQRNSYRG